MLRHTRRRQRIANLVLHCVAGLTGNAEQLAVVSRQENRQLSQCFQLSPGLCGGTSLERRSERRVQWRQECFECGLDVREGFRGLDADMFDAHSPRGSRWFGHMALPATTIDR